LADLTVKAPAFAGRLFANVLQKKPQGWHAIAQSLDGVSLPLHMKFSPASGWQKYAMQDSGSGHAQIRQIVLLSFVR
jgi:hypothetical protein